MRVALVCPYDLAIPGGVQSQIRTIAHGLSRRGHEVLVLAPGVGGNGEAFDAAIRVELLGPSVAVAANGSRAPLVLDPRVIERVRVALASFAPDVVHLHEPFAPLVGPATLLVARAPILGTFHRAGISRGFRTAGLVLRPFARRLRALSAVSPAARETAQAFLGGGAILVEIPNTIDPKPLQDARTAGERHGVAFVGRHEERKGLRILLEAAAALPAGTRVAVVGSGPATDELVARFGGESGVEFLGRCSDEEVRGLLGTCEVYVAPSLGGESFGLTLIEAMAAGAAVIASAIPGYEQAAGDAARFVPTGDASALGVAMKSLLSDPGALEALRVAGDRRVKRFSIATVLPRYEALYERIAQ